MVPFWKKKPARETEVHQRPTIQFLGEQDGKPERDLKLSLSTEFASWPLVQRAYLVRVSYGGASPHAVALCLRAPQDPDLVARIGERFAALFGAKEHLDVLFLSAQQEAEVRTRSRAFFDSSAS